MDSIILFLEKFYQLIAIKENILILAILAVGFLLKKTEFINNKFIPIILTIVGILLGYFFINMSAWGAIVGIAYSGIATLCYEAILKHIESLFRWIFRSKDEN